MEKPPTIQLDPNKRYTVCTHHILDDLHLHRRQFQIKVIHRGSGDISKPKIKEELAHKYNLSDRQTIFISGFTTNGPFSRGFGLIYDSVTDALKHESKQRLAQNGLKACHDKNIKESKTRAKKIRGLKKHN